MKTAPTRRSEKPVPRSSARNLAAGTSNGFLIPRSDEHQGEYVPPHAERLRWLTGFNGSAGMAVVMKDKAAIFVDGRYTLQVRGQVDLDTFEAKHLMDEPPARWIEENLPKGAKLAYDPWLHTIDAVARLRKAAEAAGGTLVPVDTNPLDAVWDDQPEPPVAKIRPHPIEYAGRTGGGEDPAHRQRPHVRRCGHRRADHAGLDCLAFQYSRVRRAAHAAALVLCAAS